MNPLAPPDSHHLEAAEGWIELGNFSEASEELAKISPEFHAHSAVLALRIMLYGKQKQWEPCIPIAESLIAIDPNCPSSWISRSFALHELKRTQEAFDLLLQATDRFPDEETIRYNLACYCAQLGRLEDAKAWLHKAYDIGDETTIKLRALDDPDLQPLWRRD